MKMNQDLFFPDLQEQLLIEEKKIKFWEEQPKSIDLYNQVIKQSRKELLDADIYLNKTNVYIIIKGTISAGKSTFINSLLGYQLLPSKNEECTKNLILIKHSDQIVINRTKYDNVKKASEELTHLQHLEEDIYIEAPSLFHQELSSDLRKRVFFVDTPGFVSGETKISNLLEYPDIIKPEDSTIQLILSDYTAFAEQKNKIYDSIKKALKLQTKPQKQQYLNFLPQNQLKLFWFVINKFDRRQTVEDDPLDAITQEIFAAVGKDAEIFKISAQNGFYYRVMTHGNKEIQEEFIQYFFNNKKKQLRLKDLSKAQEFCEGFKNDQSLIKDDDQEYQTLIERLNQEIRSRIVSKFEQKLVECKSNDFFLQIALKSDLKITKPAEKDELSYKKLWCLLEKFQKEIQIATFEVTINIETFILAQCKQFEVWIQIKSKQKENTKQILMNICQEISRMLENYLKLIRNLSSSLQNDILENLSKFKIPEMELQALYKACKTLFERYLDVQTQSIQNKTKLIVEKCYNDILGVIVITAPLTEVSLLTGGLGVLSYFAGVTIEATAVSTRVLTACSWGIAGGAFIGVASVGVLIFQTGKFGFQLYENSQANKNLNILNNELKKNIEEMSHEYIKTKNNVQKCLQCITKALE